MDVLVIYIFSRLSACALCKDKFAATETKHEPRPVFQGEPSAKFLIAGQAPGARAHQSGQPFTDPFRNRLRAWMGVNEEVFYGGASIAIQPMGFCFPGYGASRPDLPPLAICAQTWRKDVLDAFPKIKLTLWTEIYAHKWQLSTRSSFKEVVKELWTHLPHHMPLPHPSWRNTAWVKKNWWFEVGVIPAFRRRLTEVLR